MEIINVYPTYNSEEEKQAAWNKAWTKFVQLGEKYEEELRAANALKKLDNGTA